MNTIKDQLSFLAECFETKTRDNGQTLVVIKEAQKYNHGLVEMMHDIHQAVDGEDCRLPDDWIYSKTADLAYVLSGHDDGIMEDAVFEVADGCVDIYNADLLEWAKHGANMTLVDEAISEGISGEGMIAQIQAGQYIAIERIAAFLIEWARDRLES